MMPLRFVSLHRIVSILLATCLFSSSTPAAPQTIMAIVEEQRTSWSFWYYSSGLSNLFQGRGRPSPPRQERQADRNAKLERLEISPTNVTVELAERVRFVAVGYDADGNTVGGVKVKWTAEASTAGQRARMSPDGEFHPLVPGVFTVTAETAGKSVQTTVTVRPGLRPDLNAPPTGSRQTSSRDVPTEKIGSNRRPKTPEKTSTQSGLQVQRAVAKRSHTSKANPMAVP